jgi:hypothetical protein
MDIECSSSSRPIVPFVKPLKRQLSLQGAGQVMGSRSYPCLRLRVLDLTPVTTAVTVGSFPQYKVDTGSHCGEQKAKRSSVLARTSVVDIEASRIAAVSWFRVVFAVDVIHVRSFLPTKRTDNDHH